MAPSRVASIASPDDIRYDTHYDTLGVAAAATAEQLRIAYRARARTFHPDNGIRGDEVTMARLNEAWYVLRDPARRAVYDASLRPPGRVAGFAPGRWSDGDGDDQDLPADDVVPAHARRGLLPLPWMLVLGALALIFVFTAYATGSRGGPGSPVDGILQPGSCVDIQGRLATEVGCDGAHDGVVDGLPPIGAECRGGMTPFDDRTGTSNVCVRMI